MLAVAVVAAALVEQVRLALVVEPVVAELQPPAVVVMECVKMGLEQERLPRPRHFNFLTENVPN